MPEETKPPAPGAAAPAAPDTPDAPPGTHAGHEPADEGIPPPPAGGPLRVLHFLYYVVLYRIETGILIALLALVVLLPLIEIVNRNSGLNLWDGMLATRLSYIFTFYTGLFGGVAATRQVRHISVDLVQPHLPPRVRHKLSGVLYLICVGAAGYLTYTAYRWVFWVITPEDRFFPSVDAWWGRDRAWKVGFIVALGWMTLHFAVAGVRRLLTEPPAGAVAPAAAGAAAAAPRAEGA